MKQTIKLKKEWVYPLDCQLGAFVAFRIFGIRWSCHLSIIATHRLSAVHPTSDRTAMFWCWTLSFTMICLSICFWMHRHKCADGAWSSNCEAGCSHHHCCYSVPCSIHCTFLWDCNLLESTANPIWCGVLSFWFCFGMLGLCQAHLTITLARTGPNKPCSKHQCCPFCCTWFAPLMHACPSVWEGRSPHHFLLPNEALKLKISAKM